MDDIHTVRGHVLLFKVAGLAINTVVPCDVKVLWSEEWSGMTGTVACRKEKQRVQI